MSRWQVRSALNMVCLLGLVDRATSAWRVTLRPTLNAGVIITCGPPAENGSPRRDSAGPSLTAPAVNHQSAKLWHPTHRNHDRTPVHSLSLLRPSTQCETPVSIRSTAVSLLARKHRLAIALSGANWCTDKAPASLRMVLPYPLP